MTEPEFMSLFIISWVSWKMPTPALRCTECQGSLQNLLLLPQPSTPPEVQNHPSALGKQEKVAEKTFYKFRLEPPNFLLKCFGFVIFFFSSKEGINFLSIPA